MSGQQTIVGYIAEQLAAGHSETNLREHLEAHGWSRPAVDAAFEQYHQTTMPKPAPVAPVKRKYRVQIPRWTKARFIKLGVTFAVLAVLAVGARLYFAPKPAEKVSAVPLTYPQKQIQDVVLVGGAVANFVYDNDGKLPAKVEIAPDGNLVMCGTTCDPNMHEVSHLVIYKPAGVSFMPYASGLEAPDKDTMYIVPGGTCHGTDELGGQSVNPNSAVILYARMETDKLIQRCVQL